MFDTEEDRAEREAMANAASEVIDSMEDSLKAQKILFICALLEMGIFGFAFFAARWLNSLEFEPLMLFYMTLFAIGFLSCFAVFRLYQSAYSNEREIKNIDSEVMGGYQYYSQQNRKFRIWIFASAAAVFNVVFFNIFVVFFSR